MYIGSEVIHQLRRSAAVQLQENAAAVNARLGPEFPFFSRRQRGADKHQIDLSVAAPDGNLCDLIYWDYGITSGLQYSHPQFCKGWVEGSQQNRLPLSVGMGMQCLYGQLGCRAPRFDR